MNGTENKLSFSKNKFYISEKKQEKGRNKVWKNIAIIGSGSWGVALAVHLAKLGNNVKIWSF